MSIRQRWNGDDVKAAARGHWREILIQLGGISAEILDGQNHPCPVCGGTDRFNVDRKAFDESGTCFCNQCELSGDGWHVLQTVNRWTFAEAIQKVGEFLLCDALSAPRDEPQSPKPKPRHRPAAKTKPASAGMSFPDARAALLRSLRSKLPEGVTVPDEPTRCDTYHNADGSVAGCVLRWNRSDGEKEIRPLSMTVAGWSLSAMPEPRPLWNLTAVLQAETVHVCEGEKAAEAFQSFGLLATTSSGGSNAASKTDWSVLDGKRVVILPDNDGPGRKYRDTVAGLISQQAPSAEILTADLSECWSEIPPKGDAADWSEHFDSMPPEWFCEQLEAIAKPFRPPATNSGDKADRVPDKLTDLKLTLASEIQEQSLEWLWQDRFLIGHVNIIAGDPGLGKSLTAVDAAARVSTGNDWPDGSPCRQGKVIYATTEDGYADTVKPRLTAAGADVSQIVFLEGMEYSDGSEGPVFLDEHIGYLDHHLSNAWNVRLLILDTLQSFVGDRTNTNNNASSRRVMTPLKRLAEKHRVAILCIEHLTKGATTKADNATYRIQGSIAFTGAARSVWIVCKDKADPSRRILQASKTNLAPDTEGLGLAFTVTGPTGRPVIQWTECNISTPISELLSTDDVGTSDHTASELERACQFLRRVVTEPVSAKEIAAGCRAEMISEATLRRAKEQLGIQSTKDGKNWLWVPSDQMQQDQIDSTSDLFPE